MIERACLWRKRSKTFSLSCFVRYPCTWKRASPRRRVCDIVLRRQVFSCRRALMFLSQLQVVTGQVATSLSKFAMHGHFADSASAKAAVTVFEFGFSGMSCNTGGANGRGLLSGCRRLCQQEEQMGMLLQSQQWLALLRLGLHQICREEGPSLWQPTVAVARIDPLSSQGALLLFLFLLLFSFFIFFFVLFVVS